MRRSALQALLIIFILVNGAFAFADNSANQLNTHQSNSQVNSQVNTNIDIIRSGRPAIHTYTDKDGLPQNTILSTTLDNSGYIWAGTLDGAAYYDGHHWNVVNLPTRQTSNWVRVIFAAQDGSIWFGTNGGGVCRLKAGQWTIFNTKSNQLPSNRIRAIYETVRPDGKTIIWIGTEDSGLASFQDNSWTTYNTSNSGLPSNNVYTLAGGFNSSGALRLWIGTVNAGLALFDGTQWQSFNTKNSQLPNESILSLLMTEGDDKQELLWIGTDGGGLCSLHNNQWQIYSTKNSPIANDSIMSIWQNGQSNRKGLWLGTYGNGIIHFYNGEWTNYSTKNSNLQSDIINIIAGTNNSSRETLWIATIGGGLSRLDTNTWFSYTAQTFGASNSSVYTFAEDIEHNILWFGTDSGGLVSYQNGKWNVYTTKNSGLPSDQIWSLQVTKSASGAPALWVGTVNGLAYFENNKWTTYNNKNSALPHNIVAKLLETTANDGHKILWIGTWGGLVRYENGLFTNYTTQNSKLPNNTIMEIIEANRNNQSTLWIGTRGGGLVRLQNDQWTVYDTNNSALPSNQVVSLRSSTNSNNEPVLWIGTENGGAAQFNLTKSSWLKFSIDTPIKLANNSVSRIMEDRERRIYLFTKRGISLLTPRIPTATNAAEYTIYTFSTEDGLPSNEVTPWGAMVDSKGRIWAGTTGGAALFDPTQLINDQIMKPLFIQRTLLNGKDLHQSVASINGAELVQPDLVPNLLSFQGESLDYNLNNIVFEYGLLSYYKESETRFQTQLLNIEATPSPWTSDTKKEYTTLPEGDYTFIVWGRDYAGNITGPIAAKFTIKPAPWRTWWAYAIYAIIISGLLYSAYRYRMRILETHNQLLEEKVTARTEELAKALAQIKSSQQETEKRNEELANKNLALVESHKRADRIFSALAEILPGTVLDDKYQLNEKIGAGGFGAVYKATHLVMKRAVAIKIFKPMPGNDSAEALERFQLEAISASRINHTNAVAVLDSGLSNEGIAYLVMELLEGHTLSKEIKARKTFSLQRAIQILLPVCDVLDKAHEIGIVHRDIKPDNIFLHYTSEKETVKLVDFGIAKLREVAGLDVQSITATGGLIGTPTYMAPERFQDGNYDGRSDIYSLGVVAYEMLAGRLPFHNEAKDLFQLINLHLTKEPQLINKINANIPEKVAKVIAKALIKDPKKRLTAKEFGSELLSACGFTREQLDKFSVDKMQLKNIRSVADSNTKKALVDQATANEELQTPTRIRLKNTGDHTALYDTEEKATLLKKSNEISGSFIELNQPTLQAEKSLSTPEKQLQIEQLATAALNYSEVERKTFLDEACKDDLVLREHIEAVIKERSLK